MFSYSYNEKLMILESRANGVQKLEDIIKHYEKINNNDSLPRNLKVLIDQRGFQVDVKAYEISLTSDVVNKAIQKYNYIKEAIIVDKPYETAMAKLFEKYSLDIESYSFRVFSTENAARNWLLQNW